MAESQTQTQALNEPLSYLDVKKLLEQAKKLAIVAFNNEKTKRYDIASDSIRHGNLERLTKDEAITISSALDDPGVLYMLAIWAELALLNDRYDTLKSEMDKWIVVIFQHFSDLTFRKNLEDFVSKFFFFLEKEVNDQLSLISKIINAKIIPYDSLITPFDIAIEVKDTGSIEELEDIVQKLMNPVPITTEQAF